MARGLSRVLVAPLDRPALRRLNSIRVGAIVAEVARILHLDGLAAHRGAPVDLCAGIVVAAFIKRRRVDVELLVVEMHGCLQTIALFVVALDKLEIPVRVPAEAHDLISVVTCWTEEEKSLLIDFRLDLIQGESRIAVSTGPHRGLRRYPGGILACTPGETTDSSQRDTREKKL